MSFAAIPFIDLAKFILGPLLLALLVRVLARRDKNRDTLATAVAKAGQETVAERKLWRENRLAAEKALHDAIVKETSERTQWQLKREAESALVAGILEESTEAHKLLASIASTTRHLEGASAELKSDMRELRQHVNTMQSQLLTLHNSHAKS